jgi:hypothetical protein
MLATGPALEIIWSMADRSSPIRVTLWPDGMITPCLGTPSRYSGMYEGGRWLLFPTQELPHGAFGGDSCCAAWFADNARWDGVGDDPGAVVADLLRRLKAAEVSGRATIQRVESDRSADAWLRAGSGQGGDAVCFPAVLVQAWRMSQPRVYAARKFPRDSKDSLKLRDLTTVWRPASRRCRCGSTAPGRH